MRATGTTQSRGPSGRRHLLLRCLLVGLLVVLPALTVFPSALAQDGSARVVAPDDATASLRVGAAETFTYRVQNFHASSAVVLVSVDAPLGWNVEVEPESLELGPYSAENASAATGFVNVTVTAADRSFGYGEAAVTFTLLTRGLEEARTQNIALQPTQWFFLGVFDNPLPPPFDGPYATFLLDLAAFAFLGVLIVVGQEILLKGFSRHAHKPLVDLALRRLRMPVILFAVFLGVRYSIGRLPPSGPVAFVTSLLSFIVGILGLYLAYKVLDSLVTYYGLRVARKTATKLDDMLVPLFRKVAVVIVFVAGLIMFLRSFQVDLSVFVAGGVIVGMVLSFALQDTLSNFFSGLHILIDRPFQEGDTIMLATGEFCRVEDIGLRSTRLYFGRNHEYIIMPNNKLSSDRVTNMVRPDRRYKVNLDVGVAYGSDVDKVKEVLLEVMRAHPRILLEGDDAPLVLFVGFGSSSLDFVARFTCADVDDRFQVQSDLREAVVRRFREEGIEIPFPQQDLWVRDIAEKARLRVLHDGDVPPEGPARPTATRVRDAEQP